MNQNAGVTIIANGFQEDYTINLINALAEADIPIDFIGSSIYPKEKINERVKFINLRGSHDEDVSFLIKFKRVLKYYAKLYKYIRQTPNKTIHIQWLRFFYLEGILYPRIMKILGKKVVYTAHDPLPHMKETRLNKILFKRIYQIADEVIVHTQFIKNRLTDEFNINPDKIHVVKHGVYEVQEVSIDTEKAKQKFELKDNDFTILFFGKITKYKGIPDLVKAFNLLNSKYNNVKLIIAGKVELVYQAEFEIVKTSITNPNITLLLRYLSDDDVNEIFAVSDIVTLPYLDASQSGVMFMSYAYGKPVIAPNYGGFPFDIVPGETGDLFERGSYNSLAEKLEQYYQLHENNSLPSKKNIEKYAAENYNWKSSAKSLGQIYN